MPASHANQKKALKHKKKRESAALKAREATRLVFRPTRREILRAAAGRPHGPAFVSSDWDIEDDPLPRLISVVVTRRAPGQLLTGGLVLVDRTCLGVKNAILLPPQTDLELDLAIEEIGYDIGPLRRIEPIVAQSAVYHAIDYARGLGFEPHRDFPEAIFGPRPAALVDTPLARRSRPFYIAGPDDDVSRVLARLIAVVGPAGFDLTAATPPLDDIDDEEILDPVALPDNLDLDPDDEDDEGDARPLVR